MCPAVCNSVLFELTYGCEYSAAIKYGVQIIPFWLIVLHKKGFVFSNEISGFYKY